MSQQGQQQRPIAQHINGFEQLYPRRTSIHGYSVLSTRNDGITAHKVDVAELSCDCGDQDYNQQGAGICDHLAVALFQAENDVDLQAALDHDLREDLKALREGLENVTVVEAGADTQPAADGHSDADSGASDGSTPGRADPVGNFEAALRDAGLDPDDFRVWVDDQYGSLQVEKDGYLDDDEFRAWQDLSEELDLKWDQNNERNYLPEEALGVLD